MAVFDIFNNGTFTILRNTATDDTLGGPVASYFDDDGEIVEDSIVAGAEDLDAQIEYHRTKLLGNEMMAWSQSVIRSQRDIWYTGTLDFLGENGDGYGVYFTSNNVGSGFGRILDIERDLALGGMPDSIMLVVEVIQ